MCCAGHPVVLVGDLNADPSVIASLAKGMSHGVWIDVEKSLAIGRGVAPALTCQLQLDEDKDSRRDFTPACPVAMTPPLHVAFCQIAGFPPHFAIRTELSFSLHRAPLLTWPETARPSGQPVGLNVQIVPDVLRLRRLRISGTSTSKKSALYGWAPA